MLRKTAAFTHFLLIFVYLNITRCVARNFTHLLILIFSKSNHARSVLYTADRVVVLLHTPPTYLTQSRKQRRNLKRVKVDIRRP
jgi:hypothetical protein